MPTYIQKIRIRGCKVLSTILEKESESQVFFLTWLSHIFKLFYFKNVA